MGLFEQDLRHIHFVGIGGVHMCCIAEMLNNMGFIVTGSDQKDSAICSHLRDLGITVFIGHDAGNIRGAEALVRTAAAPDENPEISYARQKGLPVYERAQMLGLIMKKYNETICVSGVHGKTTVTSMLGDIFMSAKLDPTIVNGGYLPSINGYFRQGKSDYFIIEACEYCDSFLSFFPKTGIILNIEEDHPDYFPDIDAMIRSFRRFAELIPPSGRLVINGKMPYVQKITAGLSCDVVTFSKGDFEAKDIVFDQLGRPSFTVVHHGKTLGCLTLGVLGEHNVDNALAATAAAIPLGVEFSAIKNALHAFSGAKRRFEHKGRFNQVEVYDDYAHHPTEISATLSAAKRAGSEIWCVFQPHTHSRTQALIDQFETAFDDADHIVLLDIFRPAGREELEFDIRSQDLAKLLKIRGKDIHYLDSFETAKSFLHQNAQAGMLITMGAGDITQLSAMLVCE